MKAETFTAGAPLPMRQARAGGLAVSAMGLGCMGMSEFYGPSTEAQAREVMEAALASGVRFFDTADVYGNGHNERLLGAYLRHHPQRCELVVATKGGIVRDPRDASRRGVDNSPGYLKDAARRSQDRLGTAIDLYYLHRIADGGQHIESSMRAMAELLADGVIGAVGLSEADVPTICRADVALRQLTGGRHGLAAVQSELSLLSRTVETQGVLRACERLGILFVAYSPICRGLLGDPGLDAETLAPDDFRRGLPRFQADALPHNQRLAFRLLELARSVQATPAQLALAWVQSRGPHVVPIVGMRRVQRVQENVAACALALPLGVLGQLDDAFAPGVAVGARYAAAAMAAYGLSE
jgi:aryl-alcohol dehydrogenase-like predicted oxidoreductase